MTLTAKQKLALARAAPKQRARMAATYRQQRGRAPARNLRAAGEGGQLTRILGPPRRNNATRSMLMNAAIKSIPRGPGGGFGREQLFRSSARNFQFAPRGHGYYDAFSNPCEHVILSASVGPATCIKGCSTDVVAGTTRVQGAYNSYVGMEPNPDAATNASAPPMRVKTEPVTFTTTNKKLIIFNPGSSDTNYGVVIGFRHVGPATNVMSFNVSQADGTVGVNSFPVVEAYIEKYLSASQFQMLGPTVTDSLHHTETKDGDPSTIDHSPVGRIESIPLRGSIRLKNVTESLAVGGSVRILRYNGSVRYWADPTVGVNRPPGVPGGVVSAAAGTVALGQHGSAGTTISGGVWQTHFNKPDIDVIDKICDMIRDSDRTRNLGAHELLTQKQINTHPADFVRSTMFTDDTHFDEAITRTRYNSVLVLIEDFAASTSQLNNSYEVVCHVHRAARFGFGTILHGKSQHLKTDPGQAAKHSTKEEVENFVKDVAGGAASEVLAGGTNNALNYLLGHPPPVAP